MSYQVQQIELYGRALFNFTKDNQLINVAFEPIEENTYLLIIFSEDGQQIANPHEEGFLSTLNNILFDFDAGNKYKYVLAAL